MAVQRKIVRLSVHAPRMMGKSQFYRWVRDNDPEWAEAEAEACRGFGQRERVTHIVMGELPAEERES